MSNHVQFFSTFSVTEQPTRFRWKTARNIRGEKKTSNNLTVHTILEWNMYLCSTSYLKAIIIELYDTKVKWFGLNPNKKQIFLYNDWKSLQSMYRFSLMESIDQKRGKKEFSKFQMYHRTPCRSSFTIGDHSDITENTSKIEERTRWKLSKRPTATLKEL